MNNSIQNNYTICAPATPAGGAIGIIRISGQQAVDIVNTIFNKDIENAKGYTMHYGVIADTQNSHQNNSSTEIIDEVIVSICRAPRSYTGEDTVEISHHGSPFIQKRIIELLIHHGCRMANPGEFTQRAFLNGKMDLSQAEAVADLIASKNASTHRIALQQMRGGYSVKLKELRDQLLKMTSLLELELDFSEEDVEFADRTQLLDLAINVQNEIKRLSNSFQQGNALKNGVQVAIIGAPNVGKSTLLNALLRDDKAIVSDIQGTTRDLIEDTINLQGITFRFIDTAGIRQTDDTIEKLGIERSHKAACRALIVILLTEPGVPYPEIEVQQGQTIIRVLNKCDKLNYVEESLDKQKSICISALTGEGISQLEELLVSYSPQDNNEELLVTNARHYEALTQADDSISAAINSLQQGLSGDFVSEDLRQCLSNLSDILGSAITPDEILGNIFKNFCIGK